jgi:arsenite-transporting ATPase
VGKTTVAAATALRCAEHGHRTLVLSTDPAHSLADAFDRVLGARPTRVARNLWAQEINVLEEIAAHWGEVRDYLAALFATRGVGDVIAEEMAVFPGMEELCSLLQVREQARAGRFDCLIVDCAPTGETMRLLSFPDIASWYMEKLFPWERRIITTVGPVVQPFFNIPIPTDNVFATLEILFRRVEEMKKLLTDPRTTTIRLVLNPEKMVIKEAQRALAYLSLYGYVTDAVVCNRVFPANSGDGFLAGWRKVQDRYQRIIRDAFGPLPVWEVPLFDGEVVGLPMLARMGEALYATRDPAQFFAIEPTQEVRRQGRDYVLRLRLPFLQRDQVSLLKHGNELVISIANFRRDVFLPQALAGLEVMAATLDGGYLDILFSGKEASHGEATEATSQEEANRRRAGRRRGAALERGT